MQASAGSADSPGMAHHIAIANGRSVPPAMKRLAFILTLAAGYFAFSSMYVPRASKAAQEAARAITPAPARAVFPPSHELPGQAPADSPSKSPASIP